MTILISIFKSRLINSKPVLKLLILLSCFLGIQAHAQLTSSDFSLVPPLITDNATPNVMLVMSNDHELYKKAYSDYSDLDDDGLIEQTYNDSFTYSGYFDSNYCYSYSSASSPDMFIPYTDISANTNHRCDGVTGDWSGNFLNWMSMSRIDIVRNVLYGGLRVRDTATSGATAGVTVLERSYIPDDAHAFVKVFEGNTSWYTPFSVTAISFCNVTYPNENSSPLFRVAYGDWSFWNASEKEQCHYTNENDRGLDIQPEPSDRPTNYDYDVRVQVCKSGVDNGSDRCKPYVDSSSGDITYKPVGLLQKYGDNGAINFGLMTGSYSENNAGGVLRKDILPLVENDTASNDEIDLDTGQFINQSTSNVGIINTLNRLKIVEWEYSANVWDPVGNDTHWGGDIYRDCSHWGITKNTFLTSTSASRNCSNWGNPLSEIYLEALRYFSDESPTTAFAANDSGYITGLGSLSWSDPINSDNYCAACSIIVLSSGLNSFDTDDLGTVNDLRNLNSSGLDALVDQVADIEGILNGSYLVGNNGVDTNESCTAKTIVSLADVEGICPEVPSLEGGFDIAGLSYYAQVNDLRNDYEGVQNVKTFSVALAESLPNFELDVNGKTVGFVPTCHSNTNGSQKLDQDWGWANCSFLDIKIEEQDEFGGSMLVTWEDSLWGSDFDMDAVNRIEYCIGSDASKCPSKPDFSSLSSPYAWSDFEWQDGLPADSVQFRTSVALSAAGFALRFGISISGVENESSETSFITSTNTNAMANGTQTQDGKYISRGTIGNGLQSFLLAPGGYNVTRLVGSGGSRSIIYHEPAVYTADDSVEVGKLLENPLWYTAKYGNFNDLDDDGTPKFNNDASDTREWDAVDIDGNDGADGIPDAFYPVKNPSQLVTNLSRVFQNIVERISSGTAAAVVANSSTGLGAVYQAYYHPSYTDSNDKTVVWGGVLHAMFIDASGRFREDNGSVGTLNGTSTDYVVDIFFDETVNPKRTRFQRYLQSGSGSSGSLTPIGTPEELENFGSIWNARDVLAGISQANMTSQRTLNGGTGEFSQNAASKRYIFTYLDSISTGNVGEVDTGEIVDFVASNFNPASNDNYRYLGLTDTSDAMDLVDYIRGQDKSGWRSRLVDIPGDGSTLDKYWVLGDIVHSSPLVVNPPGSRFDILYGDETYDAFKQQYQYRRQMIYTGGNDGMLHAFNGGVWDASSNTFHTQGYDSGAQTFTLGQAHTLGAEMWAYIPMNLLPHLQWLKENNYPHVYYMDAPPQAFDVNIFPDDAIHPDGWGTILVAGMRLGGGEFPVDLDGDSIDESIMRSAIIIMDITDPERPPELIAELTDADLGFTTSTPALIKARVSSINNSFSVPDDNRWLLVFGSGPDTLSSAVSSSNDPKLYAYDLVDRELVSIHNNSQVPNSSPNGYFGDFLSVDWNNDYIDDAVYAGTVEGTELAPTGRMRRIELVNATDMGLSSAAADMSVMLNVAQPIVAGPSTQIDVAKGERWLMFGTGRLFTSQDNRSTTQHAFFGIKEPSDYDTGSVSVSDLVDTSDIIVETDGNIHDSTVGSQVNIDSTDLDTLSELNAFMDSKDGWIRKLAYNGTDPSERVFNASLVLGSSVIFTSYLPSSDLCEIEGVGYLYALNFRTGTAQDFGPFGAENGVAFAGVELGQGAASAPTAVVRTGDEINVDNTTNEADVSVVTGSTTGVTTSTGFVSAPGSRNRMSWEILDIPF